MDASRNPEYLRKIAAAVSEFKDAFKAFMELHTETRDAGFGRGLLPAAVARSGVPPEELQTATDRVARAAGRASAATGLTRMYIGGTGFPEPVDPIAAWRNVTTPKPLLEPGDVLDSAEQILGRLEALTDKAEAELPPTTGVEAMHPTIWGAARKLWIDGHFRLAVQSAAETLTSQLKTRTGLANMDATNVYEKVFNAKTPVLRWPGDAAPAFRRRWTASAPTWAAAREAGLPGAASLAFFSSFEAACRQGLRLRSPAQVAPRARNPPPYRPQTRGILAAAGPPSLGGRANHFLAGRLPEASPPLRT